MQSLRTSAIHSHYKDNQILSPQGKKMKDLTLNQISFSLESEIRKELLELSKYSTEPKHGFFIGCSVSINGIQYMLTHIPYSHELTLKKAELKNGTPVDENKSKADFSSFGNGSNTDLLGMNDEQWKAMFKKTEDFSTNVKKMGFAMGALDTPAV